MIIWRGWGILGFPCIIAGLGVASLLFPGNTQSRGFIAVGFLVGGFLCFLLGWWLNQVRPTAKLVELGRQVGPEQAELHAKQLRNQHTLFFIPLQYLGILAAVGGLVNLVMWLFQGAG
ncbi:MAG: hypothetical protein Q4D89_06130 [Arachnia propionica]|uniref:hypothetical protein n=1 Tax=Arachnia propionica TaxID=1750 RepID=UPI002709C376|nr:hypothetical protein [Arachnia propionica]